MCTRQDKRLSDFELHTLIAQFSKGDLVWKVTDEAMVLQSVCSCSSCGTLGMLPNLGFGLFICQKEILK